MKIWTTLLEKSKSTKELLSFTKYGEESFWFGYVKDYSLEYIAIQSYDLYGKNDGVIIHPFGDFQRIDYNDDYSKAMQIVVNHSEEIHTPSKIELPLLDDENLNTAILHQFSKETDVVISLEINKDEYISGYIQEISKREFSIISLGKLGESLGVSILKIRDITSILIDDIDNRKRNLLYKWRENSLV